MRDAHRLLRDATREEHERLDALFAGFDLATRDGYAGFVGAQMQAMTAVEAALDQGGAEAVIADWPARKRGHLLAADAAALGIAPGSAAPPSFDGPEREAALAGALYVVEGSRHGARHLRKLVPAGPPTAFLDADQPQGNWAKLLDRIDAILYRPEAREAATVSALRIFGVFEQAGRAWLARDRRE